jgi:hypothetical protein
MGRRPATGPVVELGTSVAAPRVCELLCACADTEHQPPERWRDADRDGIRRNNAAGGDRIAGTSEPASDSVHS